MEATSSTSPSVETYTFELSPNPIRFDPVSQITKVFFDDVNQQVFAVRSGGATGVVVKGPEPLKTIDFRMEDKGDVMSIKFSPDIKVLAIQRCQKSVEFINFKGTLDTVEYSQSCKGKSTKILGFTWTFVNEIVFVTDHGIELYQVSSEKRALRLIKTYSLQVHWFAYQPATSLLLLSSGVLGNLLHPFHLKPGVVSRLPKFEVDLPHIPKPPRLCLLERDVTLAVLYGSATILVLRHQARSLGAEIVIYTMQKEGPPRKTDILRLDTSGRFAANVVDNLVIVHHQSSRTSMLFDIRLPGESDGFVNYHRPIVPPSPIRPFKFRVPVVPNSAETVNCELYSPNWVVFQPNIIIDAKLGCLWYVKLSLQPLVLHFTDKCLLVDFLLQRNNSKQVLLQVCREALSRDGELNLAQIATIFDKINATPQFSGGPSDPSEMYSQVFSVFEEAGEDRFQFVVSVVIEYIRSLVENRLGVPHYLNEMIINVLVRNGRFYQLHQFLQYHILADSKPLACTLLSLHSLYPPASQLALDMLKRLGSTEEEIVEVLLSQGKVLSAIRFVQASGNVDAMSARKYLDVAKNQCEPAVFYAVYRFFEHRNTQIRGQPGFVKGEHCEQYVKHFESLYGQPEKPSSV
ncbi:regulator of MON1-CCZ1 complex-like [Ornithodoros turicata]|uniref:regulator of MON1-CCZ1 complex-like n=1 Tax=Ornithodoros turicata TaxID=34597 RepID=UPI00313933CA